MTNECRGCGKLIKAGDARYCGKSDENWHWDCYQTKKSSRRPTPGSYVIQMENGFGDWVDLAASPRRNAIDAAMMITLREQAKGRRTRLVQVLT